MHAASASTRPFDPEQALRLGRETFEIEAAALNQLAGALGAGWLRPPGNGETGGGAMCRVCECPICGAPVTSAAC